MTIIAFNAKIAGMYRHLIALKGNRMQERYQLIDPNRQYWAIDRWSTKVNDWIDGGFMFTTEKEAEETADYINHNNQPNIVAKVVPYRHKVLK